MRRATEDTLSLLAGAGLGVALMYLLDPDSGRRRRERLKDATREQLANAGAMAGDAFDNLAGHTATMADSLRSGSSRFTDRAADAARDWTDTARDWTDSARETGGGFASRLCKMASGSALFGAARDKFSDWRDRFSDSAGDAYDSARDTKSRWVRSAADTLGAEREHHYAGQTACALGSLALGAGLLWAFDTRQGRSRRAWLADKSGSLTRETGEFFRRSGKYVAGRMKGTVAETRGYIRSRQQRGQMNPADDAKLCARVRSELGRVVQNMGDVDVQARNGYVVIIGEVDGPEISTVANYVIGIRGVRGIDNQLRPRGSGASRSPSNIGWASSGSSVGGPGGSVSGGQRSGPAPSQSATSAGQT